MLSVTALFAYVRGKSAILGADSKRRDPLGLYTFPPVTKAYCWGDSVLFAGAGNGPNLERLANAMLADFGNFSGDEQGFLAAFAKHQPLEYAGAVSRIRPKAAAALIIGTFLVAVSATGRKRAHLLRLDFKTGTPTPSRARLITDGTNPSGFKRAARRELARYTNKPLPGDLWLSACMQDAIKICPEDVAWPVNMFVAHPTGHSYAGVSSAQLSGPATSSDPRFVL